MSTEAIRPYVFEVRAVTLRLFLRMDSNIDEPAWPLLSLVGSPDAASEVVVCLHEDCKTDDGFGL